MKIICDVGRPKMQVTALAMRGYTPTKMELEKNPEGPFRKPQLVTKTFRKDKLDEIDDYFCELQNQERPIIKRVS
jgi:hypothetical protein